jgi:hypothetical protein
MSGSPWNFGNGGDKIQSMAVPHAHMIEADPKLVERARQAADERGVGVSQFVNGALERALDDEAPQPPFSLIGAFKTGRSDLSARASRDEFEPRSFR